MKKMPVSYMTSNGNGCHLQKRIPKESERKAARRGHRHVGKRGEPKPDLVRKQIEPALLDAVLHLAARAVDFFVKLPRELAGQKILANALRNFGGSAYVAR